MTRTAFLTLALLSCSIATARADLIPSCPPGTHIESTMGPSGHPLRNCVPDTAAPVAPVEPAPAVEPTPAPVAPVEPAPVAPPAPAASTGMCSVTHGGGSAFFAGLTLVIAALALSRRR